MRQPAVRAASAPGLDRRRVGVEADDARRLWARLHWSRQNFPDARFVFQGRDGMPPQPCTAPQTGWPVIAQQAGSSHAFASSLTEIRTSHAWIPKIPKTAHWQPAGRLHLNVGVLGDDFLFPERHRRMHRSFSFGSCRARLTRVFAARTAKRVARRTCPPKSLRVLARAHRPTFVSAFTGALTRAHMLACAAAKPGSHMHGRKCTHAWTPTRRHAHTHAHVDARAPPDTQTNTQAHAHAYAHAHARTHVLMHSHAHTYTNTHTRTLTLTHTLTLTLTYAHSPHARALAPTDQREWRRNR